MNRTQEQFDRVHLTQRDLETRWKLSGRTLERWRSEGYGPAWSVLGGSIRYRLSDVHEFEDRHRHGGRRSKQSGDEGGGAS